VFDDRETILLNSSLIVPWDWRAAVFYNAARPVVNVSFMLDRAVSGFGCLGFHVTNVGLHITAVGLFYGWCTRLLRDEGRDPAAADWAAFFAAAVLAAHPVMATAVAYVTARSELLAAAGAFACLTYARRAILTRSRMAGVVAAVFAVLAIGSSSSAAALPFIVLALDAWVLRDPGWPLRAARIYAPGALAVVSAAVWRASGSAPPEGGWIANLLTGGRVVWRYLGLLLFPRGQAIVHDIQRASPFDLTSIAMFAALAAALAFAIRQRRSLPLVAFGAVWFIGVLAPTLLFPVRDAMAEHRLYLASAGPLLALASVARGVLASGRTARLVLAGVVLALAVVTYRRHEIWSRPVDLWEEAVRRAPDAWQAHWGYAEVLRELGQCDRARAEYDAASRLDPGHGPPAAGCR
jgi:hypothetical protein